MFRTLAAVLATVLLIGGAACRNAAAAQTSTANTAQQAPGQPAAAPSAATAPKPMPAELPAVLARVNGEDVTRADLERLIKNMELSSRQKVPAERRDEILRRFLDQLITYTLLRQESKARNIEVTGAEVDARIAGMRKQFPDEAKFQQALSERGMTVERLQADSRVDMVIEKMMRAEAANLPAVTDDEARAFYQKNSKNFQQPETVRASHILFLTKSADDAAKKQLRTQAESVLSQAKSGTDFAQLARDHSKDGSASQGGDLGFFPRGRMVPPFEQAAFALQVGEISGIVESQFGYHIIKLTDRRPASTATFEQVSAKIRDYLTEQKRREHAEAFIAVLKKKARIEVLV
jgi:peptidyl-prolyl cis-trans isomerase C